MKRLFFALWPDDAIRRQCCLIIEKIGVATVRPVEPNNLHATLLFLGNIDAEQEIAITAAAATVSVSSMALRFDRLSYWRKPGILCLTSQHVDPEAASLARQLAEIATQYGVTIDERPFRPHVTLARKAKAPVVAEFEPIVWISEAFCLVESCSAAEGVAYRVVKRWGGSCPS